jgi:hypothetical protein
VGTAANEGIGGRSARAQPQWLSGDQRGFPQKKLQDIFQHFTQTDSSTIRKRGSSFLLTVLLPCAGEVSVEIVAMTASATVRKPAPLSGPGNG